MSVSLELIGYFGLGAVRRLPGLMGLLLVGMSRRKLCVFRDIWVHNRSEFVGRVAALLWNQWQASYGIRTRTRGLGRFHFELPQIVRISLSLAS